jgi:hypothetical protein
VARVCIDEDEGSDKEASAESESEKSTEDEETSESETVSGSESEEVRHATTVDITVNYNLLECCILAFQIPKH